MITPVGMADIQSRVASFRGMTTAGVSAGGRLGGAVGTGDASTSATGAGSFAAALSAADLAATGIGAVDGGDVSGVPYADAFNAAGAQYGVSPKLLAAVAKVESSYRPDVVSGAGAQGLMQLMPANAAALGVNAFDPASAIDGAARMLSGLTQRFGSVDLALAAYNVGSGTISRAGGIVPGSQGEKYVHLVRNAFGALA